MLVDDKGDGIKISELKVTFNIRKCLRPYLMDSLEILRFITVSYHSEPDYAEGVFAYTGYCGYKGQPDAAGNYPDENVGMNSMEISVLLSLVKIMPQTVGHVAVY